MMLQIIQKRIYTYWFSGILTLASIILIGLWGFNLGIDFKGGTLMEVRFAMDPAPSPVMLNKQLASIDLNSLTIQPTENNGVLLRYLASDESVNQKVLTALQTIDPHVRQLRTDFVGASVSDKIRQNALYGILFSLIGIALYVAWAFRQVSGVVTSWEYGVGAIIALAHDIIIVLGIFVLLGRYMDVEIGVPFIAALLTILGYSVNDTIVVYDRVRENLMRSRHKESFESLVNRSLNETLGRSFNTSLTVLITLLAIVIFGGESIRYFGVALFAGVAFGTYSSIFVASALLVTRYHMKQQKK
ncbi:MAG: protein translocase subunit SecF [Minisyncoccota bacterium]